MKYTWAPVIVAGLLLAVLPGVAGAGDSPILTVGDWGVGEIDGRIMLYLGKGRYVDTPVPAPPRGPRWDMFYGTVPWLVLGAGALGAARLYRRRDDRPSGRAASSPH